MYNIDNETFSYSDGFYPQIIIATPARLNDIIDNHPSDIDLADIEALVLDEVDCLLQMGFEAQVRTTI